MCVAANDLIRITLNETQQTECVCVCVGERWKTRTGPSNNHSPSLRSHLFTRNTPLFLRVVPTAPTSIIQRCSFTVQV